MPDSSDPSPFRLSPDAVVWSVDAADRAEQLATRPLLVLLHGRGSHERDLFSLTPLLPADAVIASLRAPLTLGDGYTWFPPAEPGLPDLGAASASATAVLDWLDSIEGLPANGMIWLLGFSQGGAMATQLLRLSPARFTAYVCLSGFSVAGELPGDAALETLRPPVFWGRDPEDPVIPHSAIDRTAEWLPVHATVTRREYAGISHSISRAEIDDVVEFLASTRG